MDPRLYQPTYSLTKIDSKDIETLLQINSERCSPKNLQYALLFIVIVNAIAGRYDSRIIILCVACFISVCLYGAYDTGRYKEAVERTTLKEFLENLDRASKLNSQANDTKDNPNDQRYRAKFSAQKEFITNLAAKIKFDPNLSFNYLVKLFVDEKTRRNLPVIENAASAGLALGKAD